MMLNTLVLIQSRTKTKMRRNIAPQPGAIDSLIASVLCVCVCAPGD